LCKPHSPFLFAALEEAGTHNQRRRCHMQARDEQWCSGAESVRGTRRKVES
jgi:hypothetical protein